MSAKFSPIDRYTTYLLPPSLQDWLPEDHLARFVVDIVDGLDLSALERAYSGGGKQPYHPALLLSLLFYGYATGVFSSRKLEQATYDSVAFRYITADTHPDHDTIATFRKRFLSELTDLFAQVLVMAQAMGLLQLGKVSLDGTKIKANASKHKAMSWAHANKLEEQLRAEVTELFAQAPTPGPRKQDQVNFTDEESRIMPSTEGFVQGYNAQAAVDVDSHMVVTNHVTDHCNDKQEVAPTLQQLDALPDAVGKPEGLLADAGYFSQDNVARCEAEDLTPYISLGREQHNQSLAAQCEPVPECPPDADAVTRMQHRLKTPAGKAVYARRKSTVETVFGIVKEVMGFRRFHVRGLEAVNGEWTLTCLAWNLKRMHALA